MLQAQEDERRAILKAKEAERLELERAQQRERTERDRQDLRRLRRFLVVIAIGMSLAVLFAVYAFWQQRRARANAVKAMNSAKYAAEQRAIAEQNAAGLKRLNEFAENTAPVSNRMLKIYSKSTGCVCQESSMRGTDHQQSHMFSYLSPEAGVRKDRPQRVIRTMVDEVSRALSAHFDRMYAREGRPSIAPEKLLRARLLQMLYPVHSERLPMEAIDYSMQFRWFAGLNLDEEVWGPTVFTKNRDRLLEAEVAKQFLAPVVGQAWAKGLTSDEHFTVDGTLLEAWASVKSFQRKDGKNPPSTDDPGNPTVNLHGEKRPNRRTHRRPIRRPSWRARARARRQS